MVATASTAAWALHDLGLATSFGGSVFGRLAMHPAVAAISDRYERGALVQDAWRRFNILNLVSHGVFAATWLVGRSTLSGREIGRSAKALVTVKDALIVASLVSGITSMVAGMKGIREPTTEEPAPLTPKGEAAPESSRRAKVAQAITDVAGIVNAASLAGVLGVTAVLAMQAGRSRRWSFISRLLP